VKKGTGSRVKPDGDGDGQRPDPADWPKAALLDYQLARTIDAYDRAGLPHAALTEATLVKLRELGEAGK
jgi:hypothetical protein